MSAFSAASTEWTEAVPFNDREALARMIEYARTEADREGENLCAELLSAALAALDLSPRPAHQWLREAITAGVMAS